MKKKVKTQSENDVHGVLTPLKIKLKSKLKHSNPQQYRPHSNTLSILSLKTNSNDHDQCLLENTKIQKENQFSTTSVLQRNLKYHLEDSTGSELTPEDLLLMTNVSFSTDDNESVVEKSA